jgi:hypothetical protein
MRKTVIPALVILLILLLAGCSASRRRRSAEPGAAGGAVDYSTVASMITGYNITDGGFVIRRGKIELEGTSVEGAFGFNARVNRDGDFVASVRGPLGIELVRLLAVGNEIAAIDRFNRTVYIGKKDEFLRKNGMPKDFVRILFGDMPGVIGATYEATSANEVLVRVREDNTEREVSLCMDEMKVCSQKVISRGSGHEITMQFSDFRSDGGKKYASRIEMDERKKKLHVTVKIDEFVAGFDEKIEFNVPAYRRSTI